MQKTTFNLILLNSIFMIGLVMSNLFGGKIITVLGFTVAGAIITYPLTFLSTDIIGFGLLFSVGIVQMLRRRRAPIAA